MRTIKPTKIGSKKSNFNGKLTAPEMGKLWATYMGNSMSNCILNYFLQHVEDQDIKKLVEHAKRLTEEFQRSVKEIFIKENIPLPHGFTEDDVNLSAPRLFADEVYVHYLKYAAKAGLSIYSIAIPLMYREDVRNFLTYCMNSTMELVEEIKTILMDKSLIIEPPIIPAPEQVRIADTDYLSGFVGDVRPLHALEIAHLYDNIENNVTSKALIMAFSQVAKREKVRDIFIKGKDITNKAVERYMEKLHYESLPAPGFIDVFTTNTYVI